MVICVGIEVEELMSTIAEAINWCLRRGVSISRFSDGVEGDISVGVKSLLSDAINASGLI